MSDSFKNLAEKFGIVCPKTLETKEVLLLVEDQKDQRMILAHYLNKLGFRELVQCNDGMDALEVLKSGRVFGAAMASMETPLLGGIDLLREVRELSNITRPPFALSMMQPSKEKIMLATETGADEIIVKPYTLKDFIPKVRRAFSMFHNPGNPEKVYEFAKRKLSEGDTKMAKLIYGEIAKLTEGTARPLVGLARCAMVENDIDLAIKHLDDAEKRNPNFVHIFVERGRIEVVRDALPEAIAFFKKAIDLSPLNPVRYEETAELLFRVKKYTEAIEILEIAMKHEIAFPKLNHYLSQAYYAVKDYKNAIRQIRVALRVDATNLVYLNQLGISYKENEDFEDAGKVYNSIIKLDPENKPALYNKAVLLAKMEKYDEAVKILARILALDSTFTVAATKKAEIEKLMSAPKAAS